MGEQNHLQFILLANLVLLLVGFVSGEIYYIVPTNDSVFSCHDQLHKKCVTLDQFASITYDIGDMGNLTLSFLPGDHSITQHILITNTSYVTLVGQNLSDSDPTINFEGYSGLIFQDIQNLDIINLRMTRSGQAALSMRRVQSILIEKCYVYGNHRAEQLHNSALYITDAEVVSIDETTFRGNHIEVREVNTSLSHIRGGVMSIVNVSNVSISRSSLTFNQVTGEKREVGGGAIYIEHVAHTTLLDCTVNYNLAICYGCLYGGKYMKGGAVFSFESGQLEVINSTFMENSAFSIPFHSGNSNGGAIYIEGGWISNLESNYTNNKAVSGGAIYVNRGSFSSADTYYENNLAHVGGVLNVDGISISSTNDYYRNNKAGSGGAVTANVDNMVSSGSHFINNNASYGGAIKLVNGSYYSFHNHYTDNSGWWGGAILLWGHYCSMSDINSLFSNNSVGNVGGAIYIDGRYSVTTTGSRFTNNSAGDHGGAIFIDGGSMSSVNCIYTINNATAGGAIATSDGNLSSSGNSYSGNTAKVGGGVWASRSTVSCSVDHFFNNTAHEGGGVYSVSSNTNLTEANFENNQATEHGAAVHQTSKMVKISNSVISGNQADDNSTVYISSATLLFITSTLSNNEGTLVAVNSQVEIQGTTAFVNNNGGSGGAVTSLQSTINFRDVVTITKNRALYGGGIFLTESQLNMSREVNIIENVAVQSGGGIFAYQSEIIFESVEKVMTVNGNTAIFQKGGGIYAIASNLKIFPGYAEFHDNKAVFGGALFLEQNSKIYSYTAVYYAGFTFGTHIGKLNLFGNSAEYGGAVYISDSTAAGILCGRTKESGFEETLSLTECSLQSLYLYEYNPTNHYTSFFFKNNTASKSGKDVYGGLLDRCSTNAQTEPYLRRSSGLNYIKAIAKFDNQKGIELSRVDLANHISSDAVQVCFCVDDYTYNCTIPEEQIITARRGEMFQVRVVTVDQIENTVNSTVIASFSSESRLKEGQIRQSIGNGCTGLEYNVYSADPWVQLDIYADGPCGDKGISKRLLNITFQPCICPIGFEPSQSEIECVCECDKRLEGNIANCSLENETIQLSTNAWIGYVNTTNETGFVIHQNCPYDYCLQRPVNITLNAPHGADMQCAYNRTELLCGECEEGLSLVLGTSKCCECSDEYLALLVPFALLGIILVVLILSLNLTVAAGTIHGLIFYANIVGANQSLFLSNETDFLTVFISWLNLDLGIQTCFYDGMDSYAKVLLQLVFPSYLILLTVAIIIACELSQRFSTLLGNRNPVATLSTLFLLSYSKLVRTIITALQYTYLDYPDGSSEIVWLYDANVPYFEPSHVPRFILAALIIILGAVYTTLLFFGQWLPRCSNRKIMRWIRHPKYNAFIDAYQAPFSPKHRYWVGLLLFGRLVHNMVSALSPNNSIVILSVSCIVLALLLLKMINTKTYKNWLLDILETTFLTNLAVLSVGTYHIRETSGQQATLARVSMSITTLAFLLILCFHVYKYILKGSRMWDKLINTLKRRPRANRQRDYQLAPLEDEEDFEEDQGDQEMLTDQNPNYTGNDSIASMDQPRFHDPPIIRSPLILDQLREPALDILDPVTTDDYRQLMRKPRPPPSRPVTYTVVEKPDPRGSDVSHAQP